VEAANPFFEQPVLNGPYDQPARHWELDVSGQPTQQIIPNRRRAEFITPIPKPRKRKGAKDQEAIVFNEGSDLSTSAQQYSTPSRSSFRTAMSLSEAKVEFHRQEAN
jgi:type III restriction enzyme